VSPEIEPLEVHESRGVIPFRILGKPIVGHPQTPDERYLDSRAAKRRSKAAVWRPCEAFSVGSFQERHLGTLWIQNNYFKMMS